MSPHDVLHHIHTGMKFRHLYQICDSLGIRVEDVRRTGEVRLRFPGLPPCTMGNQSRRHDVPDSGIVFVRRVIRQLHARRAA